MGRAVMCLLLIGCGPVMLGEEDGLPQAGTNGSAGAQAGADATDDASTATAGASAQDAGPGPDVVVRIKPLDCGKCFELQAEGSGGQPPYEFEWQDGSLEALRSVCVEDMAVVMSVVVSDAADSQSAPQTIRLEGAGDASCPEDTEPDAAPAPRLCLENPSFEGTPAPDFGLDPAFDAPPWSVGCGSESDSGNPNVPNPILGAAGSGGTPTTGVPASTAGSGAASGSGAVAGASAAGANAAGAGAAGAGTGGASGAAGSEPTAGSGGAAGSGPAIDPTMPFGPNVDFFAWSTETFALEGGQERYLCYAKTLGENLVINGYNSVAEGFVHHVIFSRASAPEPEGFAECDIAFRSSWEPVFITGAGSTTLEFPSDAGHQLNSGTQLIVQMHLLNVGTEPVEGSLTINMRKSTVANPRPVSSFIFGTAAVELPAMQTSQVVGTCSPWQPVQLIAGFPHMHMLGTSLRFEVGSGGGAMREVFKRDPFEFDSQRIDKLELTVAAGDVTRVTCTYDNTLDQAVGYGESTRNEMCYFIGFAVDLPRQSACLEVLPPDIFGN